MTFKNPEEHAVCGKLRSSEDSWWFGVPLLTRGPGMTRRLRFGGFQPSSHLVKLRSRISQGDWFGTVLLLGTFRDWQKDWVSPYGVVKKYQVF